MSKKLAILGAGGHGKVVGEIAMLNQYKLIDFFDDRSNEIKKYPFNIVGTLKNLFQSLTEYDSFFVAIGDNKIRSEKIELLKKHDMKIVTLVHPKSIISGLSTIGTGTCVMANVAVNPGTIINEGVILNTSASIDHDCEIGKYSHVSPNCSLSGGVRIGNYTHLGSGTSVHPGIFIGNNVKTGVGTKIFNDILDNTIIK